MKKDEKRTVYSNGKDLYFDRSFKELIPRTENKEGFLIEGNTFKGTDLDIVVPAHEKKVEKKDKASAVVKGLKVWQKGKSFYAKKTCLSKDKYIKSSNGKKIKVEGVYLLLSTLNIIQFVKPPKVTVTQTVTQSVKIETEGGVKPEKVETNVDEVSDDAKEEEVPMTVYLKDEKYFSDKECKDVLYAVSTGKEFDSLSIDGKTVKISTLNVVEIEKKIIKESEKADSTKVEEKTTVYWKQNSFYSDKECKDHCYTLTSKGVKCLEIGKEIISFEKLTVVNLEPSQKLTPKDDSKEEPKVDEKPKSKKVVYQKGLEFFSNEKCFPYSRYERDGTRIKIDKEFVETSTLEVIQIPVEIPPKKEIKPVEPKKEEIKEEKTEVVEPTSNKKTQILLLGAIAIILLVLMVSSLFKNNHEWTKITSQDVQGFLQDQSDGNTVVAIKLIDGEILDQCWIDGEMSQRGAGYTAHNWEEGTSILVKIPDSEEFVIDYSELTDGRYFVVL